MTNKNFDVMSMVDSYAQNEGISAEDVFKKKPETPVEPQEEHADSSAETTTGSDDEDGWRPDASLMEGMDEFKQPGVVYDKKDVKFAEDKTLINGADEEVTKEFIDTMNDLQLKEFNIEKAKKRHGYLKLQIPPGEFQVRILTAASDRDYKAAQAGIDELFDEMEKTYPEFILEREPGTGPKQKEEAVVDENNSQPAPEPVENKTKPTDTIEGVDVEEKSDAYDENAADVTINIDKRNLPEIAWSEEEVSKIKKARTIELNIVDSVNINMGDVEDASLNAVDAVLSKYQRKSNDVSKVLPASKYRATFTGLSYPEVLDLTASNEINSIDGERKKWSLAFDHIKNQSIGPWEEYVLYPDPVTKKITRASLEDEIPAEVADVDIHYVSKFEDFMRKTSYIDLEYILWNILCATSMPEEVISIDCHSNNNGVECGHSYDWIYSPSSLLDVESIPDAIWKDIKEAGEATSIKEALKIYNTSPVAASPYVKLHSSGFLAVYGHISAYAYLEKVYPLIKAIDNDDKDPTIISRSLIYNVACSIKAIMVPNENGKYTRFTDVEDVIKILDSLNEIDWQIIMQLNSMVTDPYHFKFSMRNIVCPKCKNRSNIPINDMSRLLFIVARSLSSVNVKLRKM